MENRDSEPASAGVDATATGFSAAVRNLQVFAEEIGRVSRSSFEQNAKLIDDLSTAREVGDIVAIQTKFMTGMIATFNEHVRLMMSRMANFPLGADACAESFSEPCADPARAAEKAADAASPVTGAEPQPNGGAGVGSDAHKKSDADLAQAEPEAIQRTEAVDEVVPVTSDALPKPNGGATADAQADRDANLARAEPEVMQRTETADAVVAVTSEALPKPNGAEASDTRAGFVAGVDLPQAESAAMPTTQAAASAVPAEPEPPAAADTTLTSPSTAATATAYAPFMAAPDAGGDLGEAGVDAAEAAEQSATETTQWAAKANREAWQELAKAAADMLRAEPLPAEPEHDAETPDAPQSSDFGDHPV